jgi:plastocyanin
MISSMRMPGRKTKVASLAAVAVLSASAVAWGADTIVAGNSLDYSQPLYTQSQGERANFRNIDSGTPHNVVSNGKLGGKPLFRSSTITGSAAGTQTPVSGTQFLVSGDYTFFCDVHPNMEATLKVNNSGTPVARPSIRVAILTGSLAKAQNSGRVRVKVRALTKSDNVALKLKLGAKLLASKSNIDLAPGQVRRPLLRLGARARSRLAGRNQAKLTLVGTVPFGKARTAKKLLK